MSHTFSTLIFALIILLIIPTVETHSIFVSAALGQKLTKIADFNKGDSSEGAQMYLDTSANNNMIAIASDYGGGSNCSLWLLKNYSSSDDQAPSNPKLIQLPLTRSFIHIFSPRISPDSKEILFVGNYYESDSRGNTNTGQSLFYYDLEKNTLVSPSSLNVTHLRSADWMANGSLVYTGFNQV